MKRPRAIGVGVRSVLALAWTVLLSGCDLLDKIDPLRCVDDPVAFEVTIEDFRVSQTNQTVENSIPLLDTRAMGLRVELGANVPKPVVGEMSVELEVTRPGEERVVLDGAKFDCVRPTLVHSLHLEPGSLSDGDTVELRVSGGDGHVLATAEVTPTFMSGELYDIVFVPLRVNGLEPSYDTTILDGLAAAAHAMHLTSSGAELLPFFDVGTVVETGAERSYEVLRRLREQAQLWAGDGLLTDRDVVVGLLPRFPDGTTGVGGGQLGITLVEQGMFLHEVGHALGAPHADGCGAPAPLVGSTQAVLPVGYDHVAREWKGGNDVMSYCHPRGWMGAPLYERIVMRFQALQTADAEAGVTAVILF